VVNEQRKNGLSHLSRRNGVTKIMARIPLSMTPSRLDGRIRSLWHRGQLIINVLNTEAWSPQSLSRTEAWLYRLAPEISLELPHIVGVHN
jgi:hypothetical protein